MRGGRAASAMAGASTRSDRAERWRCGRRRGIARFPGKEFCEMAVAGCIRDGQGDPAHQRRKIQENCPARTICKLEMGRLKFQESFCYDLTAATSEAQLGAILKLVPVSQLLMGLIIRLCRNRPLLQPSPTLDVTQHSAKRKSDGTIGETKSQGQLSATNPKRRRLP